MLFYHTSAALEEFDITKMKKEKERKVVITLASLNSVSIVSKEPNAKFGNFASIFTQFIKI